MKQENKNCWNPLMCQNTWRVKKVAISLVQLWSTKLKKHNVRTHPARENNKMENHPIFRASLKFNYQLWGKKKEQSQMRYNQRNNTVGFSYCSESWIGSTKTVYSTSYSHSLFGSASLIYPCCLGLLLYALLPSWLLLKSFGLGVPHVCFHPCTSSLPMSLAQVWYRPGPLCLCSVPSLTEIFYQLFFKDLQIIAIINDK